MTARGQPWRLVCAECGSVDWQPYSDHYHCYRCGKNFDHLEDKKTGKRVAKPGVGA